MNIRQERFEYTHELQMGETIFHVREMLPFMEKEELAQDLVGASMVFDEEAGIAYEGYNAKLIRAYLILAHYTDLNLVEYDHPEGRYMVYDAIASYDLWPEIMRIVEDDMNDLDGIVARLRRSAKNRFERQHSLEYRIGKTFASLLGTEDLTKTIAKAEGLNSKLIDMLGAVQKQPAANTGGLKLAKKD